MSTTRYVSFPVPEHRIPEVAVFLYGDSGAIPHDLEAQEDEAEPLSDEELEQLLTRIYVESEPPFRALLLLLAERDDPSAPMLYADVLAAHPEWETTRSVAGGLGAFGRRSSYRYDGFWPFHRRWDGELWSHFLTMDVDIAAYLRELHGERNLPLTR